MTLSGIGPAALFAWLTCSRSRWVRTLDPNQSKRIRVKPCFATGAPQFAHQLDLRHRDRDREVMRKPGPFLITGTEPSITGSKNPQGSSTAVSDVMSLYIALKSVTSSSDEYAREPRPGATARSRFDAQQILAILFRPVKVHHTLATSGGPRLPFKRGKHAIGVKRDGFMGLGELLRNASGAIHYPLVEIGHTAIVFLRKVWGIGRQSGPDATRNLVNSIRQFGFDEDICS
jgi:hypothetical protein